MFKSFASTLDAGERFSHEHLWQALPVVDLYFRWVCGHCRRVLQISGYGQLRGLTHTEMCQALANAYGGVLLLSYETSPY